MDSPKGLASFSPNRLYRFASKLNLFWYLFIKSARGERCPSTPGATGVGTNWESPRLKGSVCSLAGLSYRGLDCYWSSEKMSRFLYFDFRFFLFLNCLFVGVSSLFSRVLTRELSFFFCLFSSKNALFRFARSDTAEFAWVNFWLDSLKWRSPSRLSVITTLVFFTPTSGFERSFMCGATLNVPCFWRAPNVLLLFPCIGFSSYLREFRPPPKRYLRGTRSY